jgi:putative heme-binding domain-containing protein
MNRKSFSLLTFTVLVASFWHPASAQHETASDLISGERAFRQYCANCHGPDGDLIANVDLGHNNFRQSYTDENLVGIIMNGIPDTPMPPTPRVTDEQASMVVAWLRSLGEREEGMSGDPVLGLNLFSGRGNCMDCHMVNGEGSVLGPDLSSIALIRSSVELESSLIEPDVVVQPGNRFFTVQFKNGEVITGRLLNHDAFTIQLLDSDEHLRSLDKSELQTWGFTTPGMPSLAGDFSNQEIADLVAYLASLRRGAAL